MRCLERNKKAFYYATFKEKQDILDGSLYTGEVRVVYNAPVSARAYITGDKLDATDKEIGIANATTREIIIDDLTCPIGLDSVLWLDVVPNQAGTQPHDFCVMRVNKSLNYISITAKKIV